MLSDQWGCTTLTSSGGESRPFFYSTVAPYTGMCAARAARDGVDTIPCVTFSGFSQDDVLRQAWEWLELTTS